MGDFVYSLNKNNKGMHSITFNGMNTWDMWHMAPKSRPFVVAPQVKTEYINVPGADGALDYTEVLTGKPRYANRTGQWEFLIDNFGQQWPNLYSDILAKLHGKYFNEIVLEDDPYYKWQGRLFVTGQFGNSDYSSVSIQYNLDPYKRPIDSKEMPNWKWNDLFGNTIYYGGFSVRGSKLHTIINDGDTTYANFSSTAQIKVYRINDLSFEENSNFYDIIAKDFSNFEYTQLLAGNNDFEIQNGNNYLFFVGNGTIRITYERGGIL